MTDSLTPRQALAELDRQAGSQNPHCVNHDTIKRLIARVDPELGIAMDGVAQKLGLDIFAYSEADVFSSIDRLIGKQSF